MNHITTQSQHDLKMAAERVSEIEGKGFAKIYGGLCHSFPVLVRTAGLAQAIAYHQSKAGKDGDSDDRKQAHAQLIADFNELMPDFDIANASLSEYMRATRRVLAVWVFYKRFAKSILNADPGNDDERGG